MRSFAASGAAAVEPPSGAELPQPIPVAPGALQRWQDMRFGMFIHWGPVSLTGHEIGWSRGKETPIEVYDNLYKQFNPTKFNAAEWMKTARAAGMKYVVFTTKHHDGFCNWDTKQTDYNIMRSPFGRDVVKELSTACKKQGLAFGTYYSTCDWYNPDFPLGSPGGKTKNPNPNMDRYTEYLRAQVSELITNYGPLHVLWFDVPQETGPDRGIPTANLVRTLQPDILINNRVYRITVPGEKTDLRDLVGDYSTPEQRIGGFNMERPWETCMTICHQWAWKPDDPMKSLKQCLQTLVLTAAGNGNLLFNVGPMPDGRIEPRQVQRLKEMGAWLNNYGESIYGTRGGPWKPNRNVASTRKGNTVFVHVLRRQGDTVILPNIPRKIARSSVLTGGRVTVEQGADQIAIRIETAATPPEHGAELLVSTRTTPSGPEVIDTIVKLELDGSAMDLAPIEVPFLIKASASNVFKNDERYRALNAFDDDTGTRWATDAGARQAWLAADLGKLLTIERVRIEEAIDERVQKFEFQYRDGQEWKTIFTGQKIGRWFQQGFKPVKAQEFRLNILEATNGPTITDIELIEK